jgi:hypothetical protein
VVHNARLGADSWRAITRRYRCALYLRMLAQHQHQQADRADAIE